MMVLAQNTTAKTANTGHSNVYAQISAFPASARWNCQLPMPAEPLGSEQEMPPRSRPCAGHAQSLAPAVTAPAAARRRNAEWRGIFRESLSGL